MDSLEQLLQFVQENYPRYAYVVKPDAEVAVDGLIFRPNPTGGLLFVSENGDQIVTLPEALQILKDDMSEGS